MQQLRNLKDQNIIKVISGVRRCGKSTLLMMFADELIRNGVQKEQRQFYNFEDLDTLALGDIYQIHAHIKNLLVEDKQTISFWMRFRISKSSNGLSIVSISSPMLTST